MPPNSFRVLCVYQLTSGKLHQQAFNADNMDHAITIRDREQGKLNIRSVDVAVVIASWARRVSSREAAGLEANGNFAKPRMSLA